MKSFVLILSLISLSSTIGSIDNQPSNRSCINDRTFKYQNDTCMSIRNHEPKRQLYCKQQIVRNACPQSCGICCKDDENFTFKPYYDQGYGGGSIGINNKQQSKEEDCKWIALKMIRPKLYCGEYINGRMIRDACPSACGFCQTLVPIHQESNNNDIKKIYAPSMTPSTSATPTITCINDPTFSTTFDSTNYSCSKIHKESNESIIRQQLCTQNSEVRQACPRSCGLCCSDDDTFLFYNKHGDEKTCHWMRTVSNELQRLRYCDKTQKLNTSRDGIAEQIRDACSATCNACKSNVDHLDMIDHDDDHDGSDSEDDRDINSRGSDKDSIHNQDETYNKSSYIRGLIILSSILSILIIGGVFASYLNSKKKRKNVQQFLNSYNDGQDNAFFHQQNGTNLDDSDDDMRRYYSRTTIRKAPMPMPMPMPIHAATTTATMSQRNTLAHPPNPLHLPHPFHPTEVPIIHPHSYPTTHPHGHGHGHDHYPPGTHYYPQVNSVKIVESPRSQQRQELQQLSNTLSSSYDLGVEKETRIPFVGSRTATATRMMEITPSSYS